MEAIKHNGDALQFISEDLCTLKLCLEAVKNGKSLEWVPRKLKSSEMCLTVIKQSKNFDFDWVPKILVTKEIAHQY